MPSANRRLVRSPAGKPGNDAAEELEAFEPEVLRRPHVDVGIVRTALIEPVTIGKNDASGIRKIAAAS